MDDYILKRSRVLNECIELESVVYNKELYITCCPSFDNDLYILKVYKCKNQSTKGLDFLGISRISMIEPIYLDSEFDNYILSKSDISLLISILNGPIAFEGGCYESKATNVWQQLIEEYNFAMDGESDKKLSIDLPIPDYSKLPTSD